MIVACPHCGKHLDRHGSPTGATPTEGAVSVCWTCGTPSLFRRALTGGMVLCIPAPEEMASILDDPGVQEIIEARRTSSGPLQAINRLRR